MPRLLRMALAALLLVGVFGVATVSGQESAESLWSEPVRIFSTAEQSVSPSLVTDSTGAVHALWLENANSRNVLVYSSITGTRWNNPTDVLLSPGNREINDPVMVIDPANQLHVVWSSAGDLIYSTAFVSDAEAAVAWRPPAPMFTARGRFIEPDLVVDGDGGLHVVTIQSEVGRGVYYLQSADSGTTWSSPLPIHLTPTQNRVSHPRVSAGEDGSLHAVWVERLADGDTPTRQIRYARSENNGASWSVPTTLAEGDYDWPGVVVRRQNEVHVVWSGSGVQWGVYHLNSADNGVSWQPLWVDANLGGFHGQVALVLDGTRNVHRLQIATATLNRDVEALSHLIWRSQGWSSNEFTARMNATNDLPAVNVSAAVGLGNTLHVLYQAPSSVEQSRRQYDIFYTRRALPDAALQAARPLLQPTEVVATESAETVTPTAEPATPTPIPTFSTPMASPVSRWQPVIIAVGGATVLIGGFAIIYGRYKRRR